jgi:non-ribosomal peptide synthase protein (TIGR01720 family)
VYGTEINDVLLTALLQALSDWIGGRSILIDVEGHGRESIVEAVDISRTMGWFTSVFPVLLDLKEANNPGDALKSIKEQLRCVPNRGIGYGVLRYLSGDKEIAEKLAALPQAELSFNYMGQFDQVLPESSLFAWATETRGPVRSLEGRRSHLLAIKGRIANSQLQMEWIYNENLYRHSTMEQLAQRFMSGLQALITHCKSPDAGGYTPSDFPEVGLSQKELDKVIDRITRISEG